MSYSSSGVCVSPPLDSASPSPVRSSKFPPPLCPAAGCSPLAPCSKSSEGIAGCSCLALSNSSPALEGVRPLPSIKNFDDMASTIMAIAKPQVIFSSRSPVFFTPIILLAPEPPNWLESPPPLEFCASTTKIMRMATMIIKVIKNTYITIGFNALNLQSRMQSKPFFAETSKLISCKYPGLLPFCLAWPVFLPRSQRLSLHQMPHYALIGPFG